MRYRTLGRTGIPVSAIGFGAWGIGSSVPGAPAYGPTDDRESRAALWRAFELGVTYFDTADLYGDGRSERLIGLELGRVRDRIVLGTKAGFLGGMGEQDFSEVQLRAALEASLKRLRTDHVDLFQLHSPPPEAVVKAWPSLELLRREGKVRAIGVAVRSPDDGLRVVTECPVASIQVNLSLVDQRALDNGLLELCAERSVGVIVRTPLCFGFLTGAYAPETPFDPTDHRSRWSRAQRARWAGATARFGGAGGPSVDGTPAQRALRFCLSHPGVSTVIPGMLAPSHVEENVAASAMGPLDPERVREIARIYRETEFFVEGTGS